MEQETSSKPSLTLRPFVESLRAGDPIGHASLTLAPLRGEGRGQLNYVLAAEALQAGTLTITEISEAGSVPELLAFNQTDHRVLLLDGEELVGAKQNRILNTSVLLPPREKSRIPVSCVEQGRWHRLSHTFATGGYSPGLLRSRKSRDVTASYKATGQARSDQGAVWDAVASTLQDVHANSPTGAMHDAFKKRAGSFQAYADALPYPAGACGVVVIVNGRFSAMDVFDRPVTLQHVWPRLLRGYAMDALAARGRDKGALLSSKGVTALLEHLAEMPCRVFRSPGLGEDWRFEADDVVGQALMAENVCVHLCAFPAEPADRQAERQAPQIMPPSQRRRHSRE